MALCAPELIDFWEVATVIFALARVRRACSVERQSSSGRMLFFVLGT